MILDSETSSESRRHGTTTRKLRRFHAEFILAS